MNQSFLKGFEKTAFISNVTKLVSKGAKSLLHKAKNVGVKSPTTVGGAAMGGLFGGMEVVGVNQKVNSHLKLPATTMKTEKFYQRGTTV